MEFVQLFAPGRSHVVRRPGDQHIRLGRGSLDRLAAGALDLADRVGPNSPITLVARPVAACALAVMVGLLVAGLSPSYIKHEEQGTAATLKRVRLIPFGPLSGEGPPGGDCCGVPRCSPGRLSAVCLSWPPANRGVTASGRSAGRSLSPAGLSSPSRSCSSWSLVETSTSLGRAGVRRFGLGRDHSDAIGETEMLAAGSCRRSRSGAWLHCWRHGTRSRFAWPDRPFLRPEMLVPFWSYFGSRNLEDLTDVIGQAMVFLPLGALLAARSWRQTFLSAVLIGFGVGVVLESGQVFLPDRTADMSDAISAAAGAGLGLALWRWGESARNSSMGATRYRVGHRPVAKADRHLEDSGIPCWPYH